MLNSKIPGANASRRLIAEKICRTTGMSLHQNDMVRGHRPPIPNPQPDPGPLPDPAPIPSPEPSPVPEPLPSPFGAHVTREKAVLHRANVEPGEIGQDDRMQFGKSQVASEGLTFV